MNYEPTNGLINVTMKHYTYSVFGFTFIQTVTFGDQRVLWVHTGQFSA